MKKFLLLALFATAATTTQADNLHSTAQLTFIPPLSTNGLNGRNYTNDYSLNLLVGLSSGERKLGLTGLVSVVRGDAGGLQWSGLANYVGGDVSGFQWAGLANVARDVDGFQLAGLVNKAANVRGVQMAGLVNIAEHSDYPVGLVNIIKDGEMGVAAGYNEIGTVSLTFRSGGRVLYGIVGAGFNHEAEKASLIGGLGAHINIVPKFRINNELTTESIDSFGNDDFDGTFKATYALLPAWRLAKHAEIFAGPSLNFMQTKDPAMLGLFPKHPLKERMLASGKLQSAFVGWQAGVQFIF